MSPFNDFYALLHSTTRTNKAVLMVYNAGQNHTSKLANFLLKKRYVSPLFSSGNFDLDVKSKLTTASVVNDNKQSLCQCLQIKSTYSIEEYIKKFLLVYIKDIAFNHPNINVYKDKLKAFVTKQNLNKNRMEKFKEFYTLMLKGALLDAKLITQDDANALQLSPIYTLKEYSNKKQLGN